jgi:hypothetical protein
LYHDAEKCFLQALLIARTIGLVPRILDILLGLANVRVGTGDLVGANKLLRVIIEHPASWAATRHEAALLVQADHMDVVGGAASRIVQHEAAPNLDVVVEQLLRGQSYSQT